jgi:uncharacterized surface protein with fasciclin (FAS1) repeats
MQETLLALWLAVGATLAAHAKDVLDTAVAAANFKTPATAPTAAGLIETVKCPGLLIVFGPTDQAFAEIPTADLDALLEDKAKRTGVLTYRVVPGRIMAKDGTAGMVKTVEDAEPSVGTMGG